jgi:hypothetical protein
MEFLTAIFTGCGKTTASVETVTEAETKAVVKEEVTTQAPTEAPTEAETEAVTEAETEAVTEAEVVVEAPVEVVTEAPVEVVAEPVEPATEAPAIVVSSTSSSSGSNLGNKDYGLISNATSDTVVMNSDGTVSTPYGTYSSVTSYNVANDCTDYDNPNHMTVGGYLSSDKRMDFLTSNKNSIIVSSCTFEGIPVKTYCNKYNITDADLAAYNIKIE